jgi:uncharacterized surface protein with fasciclin (FAS1) repeats
MLTINNKWFHSLLFGLFLLLASCHKEQYAATPALSTLSSYIQQDSSLSLLRLALQRAGLDSVLSSGGPYTIFAPVDSAFTAAGLTAERIAAYDTAALRNILTYHMLPGRIGSNTVTGFISDTMQSLNKQYGPIIAQNYYGLFVNGIKVTQGNIALGDGILHKLSGIAFPPTGDLLHALDSLPDTKLAAYIFHRSAGMMALAFNTAALFQPSIAGQAGYHLSNYYGPGTFTNSTLLVPSDAAFAVYGFNSTSDLDAIDSISRTSMIVAGILFGSLFTSDFIGGRYAGTVQYGYTTAAGRGALNGLMPENGTLIYIDGQGGTDYLQLYNTSGTYEFGNDGLSLYGGGVAIAPRIVQPNIVTTNGVLHVINQVFAPQGYYVPSNPNNQK